MFMRSTIIAGIAMLALSTAVHAETGKEEEVRLLVKKAAAHVKSLGVEKACKDFADPKGDYLKGDIYVFVQTVDIKVVCHPTNSRLIGKELIDLKDADGKSFNREMSQLAKTKGSGWITYRWPNPVSQKIAAKATYIERVGDVMVGAGAYKEN